MSYDITVIGGGPAGYVAAIKAAQLGKKVCLIEKDQLGGTCLNRGCIPSKTYLRNAEIIENIRSAKKRGIMVADAEVTVDMPATVKLKNKVVKKLTTGIDALVKSNKIELVKGEGVITAPGKIMVSGKEIQSKKIIVAGGSTPGRIPIPGIDAPKVLTSDEILDLQTIPESLLIICGGVIGIEMARIFNAFGSKVTIVEVESRIAPFLDKEISAELEKSLKKHKIKVITGVGVKELKDTAKGLEVTLSDGSDFKAELALVSVGRKPDLTAFGDLEPETERGYVKVNAKMETSISGVYAPGDINGLSMLAHAASKMGEVAAANAAGHNEDADLSCVPGCIYGEPEVGYVGLTEEQAKEKHEVEIGRFPFGANGRSIASGYGEGFVKIIVEKKYKEILGVHMIGPHASELIHEVAAMKAMEVTAEELADIIHAHPTCSEAIMEAAADSLGRCLHLPPK